MPVILKVDKVDAGYGSTRVVRDLTLHVDAGEVVALLGPNGAGKTTILLTISGILAPMAGVLELDGASIAGVRPQRIARTGVAHVPEHRGIFQSLTVKHNLLLASRSRRTRLDPVFEQFPVLHRLLNRPAGLLSGGEQQMLALSRAVLTNPRLLLIDEMSLGLAPVVVQQLVPSVRRIAKDIGCAVLLVEQHIHVAAEIADRAYVLSHGELRASVDTESLIANLDAIESSYLGTVTQVETSSGGGV
jgi:branched-chain amino acid transport system ATP-binding protein